MSAGARRPRSRTGAASTAAISARAPRPSGWSSSATSGPAAIGVPVGNIGLLHQRMDAAVKGYPYAKAAMDIAAYDLAGRARGIPVHDSARRRRARHHPDRPLDRPDGDRGRRARGRQGRRRGHPHHQDQGRRRAGARRRDGAAHPRRRRPRRLALRRRQRGLQDAGRSDQDHPQDGSLRPHLRRAAGRRHRAHGGGGARRSIRR